MNPQATTSETNESHANQWLSQWADGDAGATDQQTAPSASIPDADTLATWANTHLIGDAMRANARRAKTQPKAKRPVRSHADFVHSLRAQLATSEQQTRLPEPAAPVAAPARAAAANDKRWKLVAGLSSLAAVGSLAFSLVATQRAGEPQMAQTASPVQSQRIAQSPGQPLGQPGNNTQQLPDGTVGQVVVVGGEMGVMIRDARMTELMAQHKQLGGNALQAPSGFLRNATFSTAGCAPNASGAC